MVIYFLTTQTDVCLLICSKLEKLGHQCKCFSGHAGLLSALIESNSRPDLIAFDYFSFHRQFFNPYEVLKDNEIEVPYFIYNDPFPPENSRAFWWLKEITFAPFKVSPEPFEEFFFHLQGILISPEIKPFVRGLREPLPFSPENNLTAEIKFDKTFLYDFKKKHKVQRSVFSLLRFLLANQDSPVSLDDITEALRADSFNPTANSVRVCLSKLRNHLKAEDSINLEIIREGPGYRLICLK